MPSQAHESWWETLFLFIAAIAASTNDTAQKITINELESEDGEVYKNSFVGNGPQLNKAGKIIDGRTDLNDESLGAFEFCFKKKVVSLRVMPGLNR